MNESFRFLIDRVGLLSDAWIVLIRLNPKSATTTVRPFSLTKQLSDLRSLWIIFNECKYSIAAAISLA